VALEEESEACKQVAEEEEILMGRLNEKFTEESICSIYEEGFVRYLRN
jgi:hypothetical protein